MTKTTKNEHNFYIGASNGKTIKEKNTDIKNIRAKEILQLPNKTWFSNR